jgi:type IV secretory pathway VirB2 component (pilin)
VSLGVVGASGFAQAATTGPAMPWDTPLERIRDSLSGTVAHIVITVAIILTGILFALGEEGSGMRRVAGIALGGSLALGAITFMTALGFSGAVIR